jgi:uncharacterized protein (TIGR03067 family)
MKIALTTLGLTVYLLLCTAIFADEKSPAEVGRDEPVTAAMLAGTYRIVSAQKGDEKTPPDKLEGNIVTFTENTIVALDADEKQTYAAKFTLDTSKSPTVISMVSTIPEHKGASANGLIHRDGETVKLIYALPDEGEMPSEFKAGKGQRLLILKKFEKTASVPSVKK